MSGVTLRRLSKIYAGTRMAVDNVDLEVWPGEFLTLLGPSGCGKTTTLRMIAGLETPTAGQVLIGKRDCTLVHPRDRGVGLVFQSYALYPHMTVRLNIGLNLLVGGLDKVEVKRRVEAIARILKLDHLLDRRPPHLSGGERQRVALGRALVRNPEVLLMDEPLSNLDLKLREYMRTELKRLHAQFRHTVVYVTHDQAEALSMSDRVAVMRTGRIEQVGTPDEVYVRPANLFVASFLGSPSINQFSGRTVVRGDALLVVPNGMEELAQTLLPDATGLSPDQPVTIGVRPEDIIVKEKDAHQATPARVSLVEPLGASKLLCLDLLDGNTDRRVMAIVPGYRSITTGAAVAIEFRAGAVLVFDPATQTCLARSGSSVAALPVWS